MSKRRAGEHSRSDYAMAVTDREHALKVNEELRREGIAAEYEVKSDGERMALVFRDRNGRREAMRHLGVFDRDGNDSPRNL